MLFKPPGCRAGAARCAPVYHSSVIADYRSRTRVTRAMIRVVNVTHHYHVRPVLKDISFEVKTGEVIVVVGPNGMGKTTLLGVLAGVLWPHAGHVEIDGVVRRQS